MGKRPSGGRLGRTRDISFFQVVEHCHLHLKSRGWNRVNLFKEIFLFNATSEIFALQIFLGGCYLNADFRKNFKFKKLSKIKIKNFKF